MVFIVYLFICRFVFRAGDTEADLDAGLATQMQRYYIDLEKFLNWLTEAETTANVLQNASYKERLLEDPATVRRLLEQWQVGEPSAY